MGYSPSTACECDAEEQTVDHVLYSPSHRTSYGMHGLTVLDESIEYLLNTWLEIQFDLAVD